MKTTILTKVMNIKKTSSGIASALVIFSSGIGLSVVAAIVPSLNSPVQAQTAGQPVSTLRGCFLNVSFTGKIAFNPTNIRQQPSTGSSIVGKFTQVGQAVSFSGITTGNPVADAWDGQQDNMWYRLADGRGWVASAVVSGYPPRANCIIGLPKTTDQANKFFKMQFRDANYNPTGPLSSANCGPASLAMALAALGREPSGLNIQQSIDRASDLMGRNRNASFSSWAQLQTGVRKAGGTPVDIGSWSALDQSLSQGKPVILNGFYAQNWRNQFPARTGSGTVAHLNAVLGKTSDGRYIIADPMHTGGTVAMNQAQLSVFFRLSGQNGNPWGIAVTGL